MIILSNLIFLLNNQHIKLTLRRRILDLPYILYYGAERTPREKKNGCWIKVYKCGKIFFDTTAPNYANYS